MSNDEKEDVSSVDEELSGDIDNTSNLSDDSISSDAAKENNEEFGGNETTPPPGLGGLPSGLRWIRLNNVLSLKMAVPVVIIGGVIVLIILVIVCLVGPLANDGPEYIPPLCREMSLTFGADDDAETVSVSLEQYIISHIYSATKGFKDVNPNLYKTLAIVVNTQVQSSGICRETIVPEVDDIYTFELLDKDREEYLKILEQIEEEKNLVMVYETQKKYYNTSLDGFCYNNFYQDREDNDIPPNESFGTVDEIGDVSEDINIGISDNKNSYFTLQQLNYSFPFSWVVENVSNERFYKCPCNFPEGAEDSDFCYQDEWNYPDDGEPDRIYVDGGSGQGVSIYAAHYFSSVHGLHYEDILKMFYSKDDWILMSNDQSLADSNGEIVCSKLNFYSTPLSRDEFISLVNEYLKNKGSTTARLFRENAGMIYDKGIEMGANPEMVYIIAEKEQNWKDSDFTVRCFNFYGFGVYNGQSSGTCFDSFESGVEKILSYVKEKGNLTEFTKVYSYLGDYLANPGSWGDGGCIYLKLPEIYGPNYSRCNSSYHCASSKGGAGCILTTDAEKQAYIDWQASKILEIRKSIFHIEEEVCESLGNLDADVGEASQIPLADRMKWLFPNGIPKTQAAMQPYLKTITVPVVDVNGNRSTHRLTVHTKLASEITAIFNELANIGFPVKKSDTYGYGWRKMASGTGSLSHHSYGVTIDLNANDNPPSYWNAKPNPNSPYYNNSAVVQIFKVHGFYWGGNWSAKFYDPMHFTYTNH